MSRWSEKEKIALPAAEVFDLAMSLHIVEYELNGQKHNKLVMYKGLVKKG